MGLAPGERVGAYEVVGPVGAGGMGEVYRARDPRLGREVAIKVLPREWAENPERLRRFEQEGRAASALAHPNIVTVHELGSAGGHPYLVTEMLEGETLRHRLNDGALPARKAVEIAADIARGLGAAHERGIVHRDLKPDNVFLTSDGRVKILDFGIARLTGVGGSEGSGAGPLPPTIDLGARDLLTPSGSSAGSGDRTAPGVVLGTLGYMAPEQARGLPAGPSADLFALGALLYEMLTGRAAFRRPTPADTVAALLSEDPPELRTLGRGLSPVLAQLVACCLEKRPEDRFGSARDLAFALDSLTTASTGRGRAIATRLDLERRRRLARRTLAALAAAAAAAAAFLAGRWSTPEARRPAPVLAGFRQITDLPGVESFPSLAPDGVTLLFDSPLAGNHDVYLQRVEGQRPINLTESSPDDDRMAAFSPDGASIAFRSEREGGGLFVMGATGESARRLTDEGFHPTWTPDGREIVYSTGAVLGPQTVPDSELWAVDLASGRRRRLLRAARAVQPSVSPRGLRVVYWTSIAGQRDLATVPLGAESGVDQVVPLTDDVATDWAPVWSADGRWIYYSSDRDGGVHLWRLPVDEATGRRLGEAQSLAGVGYGSGPTAVGRDGRTLVYRAWVDKFDLERVDFDPDAGEVRGTPEVVLRSSWLANPDVSPDGRWLATNSWRAPVDLWLLGAEGGELRRLTADAFRDARPTFSPDGRTLAFHSARTGKYEVWTVRTDGSGLEQLTDVEAEPIVARWAPDGRHLAAMGAGGFHWIDASRRPARVELRSVPELAPDEDYVPWSFSSDGRRLLGYVVGPGDDLGDRGVAVYDFAARRLERLTPTGWSAWYLPDDRRIVYLDRMVQGKLRVLDPATGESRVVLGSPATTPLDSFAPTRDRRRLYLTRALGEGDLWLATLTGDD
jgi:Tol biopolymer transport system component